MDTCNSVIQPLIPLVESKLAWHNSRYNCASTALPQLYAAVCAKSRSSGRKHKWTCTHFLSANKKDPISAKMKLVTLRSKVTSHGLGTRVDNWSHRHHIDSGSFESISGWYDTEQLPTQLHDIEHACPSDYCSMDTKPKDETCVSQAAISRLD